MASSPLSLEGVDRSSINAPQIVTKWLSAFETTLTSKRYTELDKLFLEDSWWRDTLALSWDFRCPHGLPAIIEYLEANLSINGLYTLAASEHRKMGPSLKEQGPVVWVESAFSFETKVGRGRGVLKLSRVGGTEWKVWTISTQLEELKGHELKIGARAPRFDKSGSGEETKDEDPTVVVIGAGQSGLITAAQLQHLGINVLIVDKTKRVGDVWRNRYKSLRLHTTSYKDHMPYLNFPSDWPTFVSKDRIADFIEHYASILKLNVSLDTELKHAAFDAKSKQWTLETTSSDGKTRTLHPKHIVLATGLASNQPSIPTFTDQDKFKGELYHSGKHNDASKIANIKNKKIVIVGSSTSAHDIAQDFVVCGAKDVTMIQRGPNNVVSTDFILKTIYAPLEEGLTIADADFQSKSTPNHVTLGMMPGLHAMMEAFDHELLEGLAKTEYVVSNGENGPTWFYNALTRAGGFYIDVGASRLIIDGKIKVKRSPGGIKQFTEDGLILTDGRKVEAHTVILATGWKNMGETVKSVIGEEAASRCGPVWGLDEEGEMRSVWRHSGHPGFWLMVGNLEWSRSRSMDLALQIKAVELGLNPQHYR